MTALWTCKTVPISQSYDVNLADVTAQASIQMTYDNENVQDGVCDLHIRFFSLNGNDWVLPAPEN
jgi:hypothetical protein